jgi:glycosyltransferase involved in cell wall biosynthesis
MAGASAVTPLRIAMMVSGAGINGAIVHALLLTRYLSRRGHQVLLLHRPGAWIAQQSGLDKAELFATSFGRSPGELIRVTRRLNAFAPDVIHSHMSSAHTYGMLARWFSRRVVVATAHSQSIQLHWCFNNIVIATSRAAAEHHHRYNLVRRKTLRTQSNFIDAKSFPMSSDDERRRARNEFGFADSTFVIGSVGSIEPRKNQLHLVQALAEIARSVADAKLLLVGWSDAAYLNEIKREADRLGVTDQIVFTGPRQDVPHVLSAMDVFALVSRKETGPLAVLEAMARGLPALVTNIGELPEFVGDGAAGVVVRVGDVDAIARQLVAMARDPQRRSAMGQAAAAIVRDKYDIARAGPNVEAILTEASHIKNRPPLGFVTGLFGEGEY